MPPAASQLLCAACGAPLVSSAAHGLCVSCVAGHSLTPPQSTAPAFRTLPEGFERVDELGRGGMGVVVLAHQRALDRYVALKELADVWRDQPRARERFMREARAAARLSHPGIVPVLEIGDTEEHLWYTMEYVEGGDVRTMLERRGGRLPWREAVELVASVADAIHHAHEHGIAHRDLKPSNILLDRSGRARVCDFGLAWLAHRERADLTSFGEVLGTPAYLAPEAADPTHPISDAKPGDQYALGAVLFHLIAGRPPFVASTPEALLGMIRSARAPSLSETAPPPLRHPQKLDAICARCLEKNPRDRFASAFELARALRHCLEGRNRILPVRRRTLRRAGAAVVAVAAIAAGASLSRVLIRTPDGAGIAAPDQRPFVIVRPLESLSHDDATRVIAAGLQEDIVAAITRISDLRVVSASSARAVARRADGEESSSALGATSAVEATVQRFENMIRIVARLVDTADGAVIWTQTFDGRETNLFNLQTDIAIAVATQLRARLLASGTAASRHTTSSIPQAQHAYLRARALIADTSDLPGHLNEAENLLREAVAADSTFALAWAKLSQLHLLKYHWSADRTSARLRLGLDAAQSALRINPDLPEAAVALATYYARGSRDYATALPHLHRVLKLAPNNAEALELLGNVERRQGDFLSSEKHYQAALQLDPLNPILAYNCADTSLRLRNYPAAKQILEQALTRMPGNLALVKLRGDLHVAWHGDLGPMRDDLLSRDPRLPRPESFLVDQVTWLILEHRLDDAITAIDRSPVDRVDGQAFFVTRAGYRAMLLELAGRIEEARVAAAAALPEVESMLAQDPDDARVLLHAAELRAILGQTDEALRLAQRTLSTRDRACVDAFDRGLFKFSYAVLLAMHGRKVEATETIRELLREPNQYSEHRVALHPAFSEGSL